MTAQMATRLTLRSFKHKKNAKSLIITRKRHIFTHINQDMCVIGLTGTPRVYHIVTDHAFWVESIVTYHRIYRKKVYHIVTDNFVNLFHISYAWLYKTECWGRKFHAFSLNSHRNCKIFMTNFYFIFDTICVPYIFRKSIFGWNCDHDTPLCDTPLLEDTPLCDTPDQLYRFRLLNKRPIHDCFSNN